MRMQVRNVPSLLKAVALSLCIPAVAVAQGWITHPRAAGLDESQTPLSLQFRRELTLPEIPASFPIKVSADNRFILYVNGRRVSEGPARGNLAHWRYETVELAPFLKPGHNVLAAQVWNDAKAAPLAQMSSGHTGFWLRAVRPEQHPLVDSGARWRVRLDTARTVSPGMPHIINAVGPTFYAAGPPESFDGALQARDWAERQTSAKDWRLAVPLNSRLSSKWTLVADTLPKQRYERVPTGRLVRAAGVEASTFPDTDITVPPNTHATLLVDAGRLLAAYPRLLFSRGAHARIEMTYVESLYDPAAPPSDSLGPTHARYADRSTVKDGLALGLTDSYQSDGSLQQSFEPFWWRAWRFVEIHIHTFSQPLTLHTLETWETGYPFVQRGHFVSNDPALNSIWQIGWNTALLDAHETYMDTAYWEQLQYIGDSRIQMLLSYQISGDTRLAVQALDAFDQSRVVERMPQSAWPGVLKQVIPPFALLWIGALHDYWMYEPDTTLLQRSIPGTRAVLDEFANYVLPSGLVGPMPGWPFVDWRPGLDGWAFRGKGMLSCIITMQYIGALHEAAELERALADQGRSSTYSLLAQKSRQALNTQCWDRERQLYADTPAKEHFSQHGAALAVLYDIAPKDSQQALLRRALQSASGQEDPPAITTPSYYFSFYLARALQHAGLADRYLEFLRPWQQMLERNFTTWPETPDPSRSDSHAWSAHPTGGLLEYVAGVAPAAPGFAQVRVEPHLGDLKTLDAAVVHPKGLIETRYEIQGDQLFTSVTLPEGVSGEFVWKGRTLALTPGQNTLTLASSRPAH